MFRIHCKTMLPVALAAWLAASNPSWAQADHAQPAGATTLREVFEQAWQRQPEARSGDARLEAVNAARAAAASWTVEPAALSLQTKSDRFGSNRGNREYEVGLAVPLWLPGERSRSGELAEAEARALDSRLLAAKLRLSGLVRETWWSYQRTESELRLAEARLANARQLADDVARRVKAGDLSRADQHQASGAAAQAEAGLAEAQGNRDAALSLLRSLAGHSRLRPGQPAGTPDIQANVEAKVQPEPLPQTPPQDLPADHPAMLELIDRASAAWRAAELAGVRTRANPELVVAGTRSREQVGADNTQTYTLGIRFPFGAGPRAEARRATARAEALDAEASAELERSRVIATIEAARVQVEAAQGRVNATEKRARFAGESRGFFDKSFRLGETDLPTRLRIELEAAEAERQLARARIDLAAAISNLRQALGLLPE